VVGNLTFLGLGTGGMHLFDSDYANIKARVCI